MVIRHVVEVYLEDTKIKEFKLVTSGYAQHVAKQWKDRGFNVRITKTE